MGGFKCDARKQLLKCTIIRTGTCGALFVSKFGNRQHGFAGKYFIAMAQKGLILSIVTACCSGYNSIWRSVSILLETWLFGVILAGGSKKLTVDEIGTFCFAALTALIY